MDNEQTDVNTEEGSENTSSESTAKKSTGLNMSEIVDEKGVSLTNRFGELHRKLNKVSDLEMKLDQVLASLTSNRTQAQAPAVNADFDADTDIVSTVKKVVDSELRAKTRSTLAEEHNRQFKEMAKIFPELDKDSPDYDPTFYKKADSIYQKNYMDDPKGAEEAIQIAAAQTGRLKRLAEMAVLQDEAKRSRKLSEGSSSTKNKTAATEDSESTQKAVSKFGIDPKFFKKAKQNLGIK